MEMISRLSFTKNTTFQDLKMQFQNFAMSTVYRRLQEIARSPIVYAHQYMYMYDRDIKENHFNKNCTIGICLQNRLVLYDKNMYTYYQLTIYSI